MGELDTFARLIVEGKAHGIDVQRVGDRMLVSDRVVTRRGSVAEWHAALAVALPKQGQDPIVEYDGAIQRAFLRKLEANGLRTDTGTPLTLQHLLLFGETIAEMWKDGRIGKP